ncbi:MAG: redoxin domain-containing protein [Candidatus Eisenbacteria bacterium]
MNFGPLFAAALLAAVSHPDVPASRPHPTAAHNAVSVTNAPASPASPVAVPAVGEVAPDFTYQSHDYLWQNLHNMLEQGHVLLVFGATEAELRLLEAEREQLLRQGVIPVAVIERRENDVWNLLRRADLGYSLLSDPHGAIAEQYGVYLPQTRSAHTAWFLVDQSGRVRETGTGTLPREWSGRTAMALGHGDVRTASTN